MGDLLHSRDSVTMKGRGRVRAGQTSNQPHGGVAGVYPLDPLYFQTARLLLRGLAVLLKANWMWYLQT